MKNVYYNNYIPFTLEYRQIFDIEMGRDVFNWRISKKREQYVSIDAVHIHPQFNENTFDSDIALFHFATDVIMTDYIQPICLPVTRKDQALFQPGNIGVFSGWGARQLNKNGRTQDSVRKLHEVEVPLVSQVACQQNHHKYVVTPNMFCAGRLDGQGDACNGDSGGPLTVEDKATGRSVLLGIVSWGDPKCRIGKYGVYTKVQNYIKWINSHINTM